MTTSPHHSPKLGQDLPGLSAPPPDSANPRAAGSPDVIVGFDLDLDPDTDESTEWGHAKTTEYAPGAGLPARGLIVATGITTAACAMLDLALTGRISFFFDLCFVVICLVAAMSASPRALFTVAVLPPLVFATLVGVVAVVAPTTITSGSFSRVFLTGLAAHAVPLCAAYATALAVACARGLARRSVPA